MKNSNTLAEKTFDLLESTGLNWSVKKEALSTADGKKTESFGLFKGNKWLGTVGNTYEAYQNSQLAETIIQATEGIGIETTRGGMLKGGEKVYLQAELPSEFIGESQVLRWITALNAHNGHRSIGFGSTNTVVVCQNTFNLAYKDLAKFQHTSSAQARIDAAIQDMRIALGKDEELMTTFKRMADIKLKDEIFADVLKACFDATLEDKQSELSTRKKNQLTAVSQSISTELKLEGNTLWGLFNGITRYTNHVATKPEEKDEYVLVGGGYKTAMTAFETISSYMETNKSLHINLSRN